MPPDTLDEGLVPVAEFQSLAAAREHALVILAMGQTCWILNSPAGDSFEILADGALADVIGEELAAYAGEQADQEVEPSDPPAFDLGLEIALPWLISLFAAFHLQLRDPSVTSQFCNSSLALVEDGQWWRPVTALFLHADFEHLMGNIAWGLIFCLFVAHTLGPRTGWALILVSGALANASNCWIRYPARYYSLGASTATFGALGILVGCGVFVAWRSRSYRKLSAIVVPAGSGIILLGWLGGGEPPTDILGHLLGFLAGCSFGLMAAPFRIHAVQLHNASRPGDS